jgi:hypothetical protein
MRRSDREVQRARVILSDLIDLSGMSRRELERRLIEEDAAIDVSRLLSGKLDLKLRHILEICRLVGIYPLVFFNILLNQPEPSPLIRKLRVVSDAERLRLRTGAGRTSPLPGPAEEVAALRRRVGDLIAELQEFIGEPTDPSVK